MRKIKDILKIIFLTLAILTMLCTLYGRAKADGVSDTATFYDYIHSITDTWSVSDRVAFNTALDSKITSDYYFVTNGSDYIIFSKKPSLGLISQYTHYQYAAKCVGFNNVLYPDWQDSFPFYIFQTFRGGAVLCEVYDFQAGMNVSPMRFSWTGNYYYNITDFGYSYTDNFTYTGTWYGNVDTFYEIFGSSGTGYSYGWSVSSLPLERPRPAYVEDERLKFSTFSLPSGGYYLQTDIRDFGFDNIDGSSASQQIVLENNSIDLTFICDEEVYEVTLDSSNSVISSDYIFSTDYSSLFNFDEFETIYIDKAEFTQVIKYRVSEQRPDEYINYKIDCEYYLKQYVPPISPAEIEEPVYDDPGVVPQSEISETIEMLKESSSSAPNAFSGDWVYEQNHPVVPSWADHYDFRVIYSDDNSFVGNLVNSNVWNYYTDNNPNGLDWLTSSFIPRKFVFENSAFAFYDMIIISVYSANVALSPDNLNILVYNNIELQGYIVFYSERFYIHQQAITQQNMLSSLEYIGYNAKLYYDYMYDQLQDFELKNLLAMGSLIDYAKKENNLLSTIDLDINNNTAEIITAIKNNKFIPDYSSLVAEMELIKSAVLSVPVSVRSDLVYLFLPTYDGISVNFQQYHDDIGILALPFDETKLVYDTMKNNYSGNFEIDVPELKVSGFTLYEGTHFSFNVWSLFDNNKLSSSDGTGLGFVKGLRYFVAFLAIYGSVASTYAHIFRRENTQD